MTDTDSASERGEAPFQYTNELGNDLRLVDSHWQHRSRGDDQWVEIGVASASERALARHLRAVEGERDRWRSDYETAAQLHASLEESWRERADAATRRAEGLQQAYESMVSYAKQVEGGRDAERTRYVMTNAAAEFAINRARQVEQAARALTDFFTGGIKIEKEWPRQLEILVFKLRALLPDEPSAQAAERGDDAGDRAQGGER